MPRTEQERRSGSERRALPERRAGERRRRALRHAARAVDYVFALLYGLLAIRFALTLLGASEAAGFVRFVHALTDPLHRPFEGIIEPSPVNGRTLELSILVAVAAYALLHLALRGLLRLFQGDRPLR